MILGDISSTYCPMEESFSPVSIASVGPQDRVDFVGADKSNGPQDGVDFEGTNKSNGPQDGVDFEGANKSNGPQDGADFEGTNKSNCTPDSFTDSPSNKENHTGNATASHEKPYSEGEVHCRSSTNEAAGFIRSIEGSGNENDLSNDTFLNTEADSPLWWPPGPEDSEDDVELSVANNDEDDDDIDGTEWGQPSFCISLDEQQGFILSNKEKRRKVMMEAMHIQFKFLVSRFLGLEGVESSEDGDRWIDIVASLSWQAALLVKPDATEGRAMDPGFYVKVKCIACGSRDQSQVIRGLVFKKHTAHKQMCTNFRNARLLLVKGVLGESVSGLSSFNSMEQEKGYVKSVIEIIEALHPNVVLVEKTASRDAQEYLLQKGITLVFDMKLSRLERIARCTGSRIVECADITMNTGLKKCDSFQVKKIEGDPNGSSNGAKKYSKTLMFFEGFSKPLGCTILLRGAHIEELKKVKRVMQYTVFAAYHLILETSFFADQKAMSFDMNLPEKQISEKEIPEKQISEKENDAFLRSDKPSLEVSLPGVSEISADLMAPNGPMECPGPKSLEVDLMTDTEDPSAVISHCNRDVSGSDHPPGDMHRGESVEDDFFPKLLPGQCLLSFGHSHKELQADNLLLDSACSYEPFPSHSLKNIESGGDDIAVSVSHSMLEMANSEKGADSELEKGKLQNGLCLGVQNVSVSDCNESLNQHSDACRNSILSDNDNAAVMSDTQSILILFSSRCTLKETICEQNQLSRIKYYGNFDMSLGRFLQDVLLNQSHSCPGCGEPSDAHMYGYTHRNGKLTVQVRKLSSERLLPGEKDEKLWMWTRCLKCEREGEFPRPTKRVIMSTAARGLSFGKFLELSFSTHSASKMLSQCGHLLHRDCLRFFGFGSKVAMFRYSPVEIYTACKPPPVIEFNSSITQEWFKKEADDVKHMGEKLFSEVRSLLQKMKPDLSEMPLTLPGSIKDFSEVEEMLKLEIAEFEASMQIAIKYHGNFGKFTSMVVNLQYMCQELFLGLYVWDCRLSQLQLSKGEYENYSGSPREKVPYILDKCHDKRNVASDSSTDDIPIEAVQMNLEKFSASISHFSRNIETERDTRSEFLGAMTNEISHEDAATVGSHTTFFSVGPSTNGSNSPPVSNHVPDAPFNLDGNGTHSCLQLDSDAYGASECLGHTECSKDLDMENEGLRCNDKLRSSSAGSDQHVVSEISAVSPATKASGPEDWIWLPFPEMHKIFFKENHCIYMKRFEDMHSHNFRYLASLHQKKALQDRDHLDFPLGSEGIIISIHEEEVSSIIACALTKVYDLFSTLEIPEMELGVHAEHGTDGTLAPASDASLTSSFWSSNGSASLERVQSYQSFSSSHSSDEVSTPGFESSFENLQSSENLHFNISLTDDKAVGKCKYSVACIYAREFYALRKHCCSSEVDYISSLSRCRKWDAQGGKSKAMFAKTLDDRFIIKEIKRTELDSLLKFGIQYFKHILDSLNSGSQTCLAKILGIYQVKQIKGGKENRYDLMVMENLLYGRDVTRTYDLKGAVYARYISDPNKPEKVLLDQNFIEDMVLSPMYIGGRTKHLLQRAIWNDTSFLTAINVMDYSLLVGVDKKRHELVFGIIDYLRQYTWDKQLETWVKSSLVPKNSLPTVISPKEYKKRFRKFMSKYFLTVPDSWASGSGHDRSNPCSNGIVDSS